MIIDIFLDDTDGALFAGQLITGQVDCICTEETEISSVAIRIFGRAETEWDDVFTSRGQQLMMTFRGRQQYFSTEFKISKGITRVRAGRTSFNFSFSLPIDIPSSFEGPFGNIRYFLKAIVTRPEKYNISKELRLLIYVKLNVFDRRELMQPYTTVLSGKGRSFCCRQGPVSLNLFLPITGVMPNQDLQIHCHLINESPTSVTTIKFKVMERTEYVTTSPCKATYFTERFLTRCSSQSVRSRSERHWTTSLKIPLDTYCNTEFCDIIRVGHYVVCQMALSYFQKCIHSEEMAITIGTQRIHNVKSYASLFSYSKTSMMGGRARVGRRVSDVSTASGLSHADTCQKAALRHDADNAGDEEQVIAVYSSFARRSPFDQY